MNVAFDYVRDVKIAEIQRRNGTGRAHVYRLLRFAGLKPGRCIWPTRRES